MIILSFNFIDKNKKGILFLLLICSILGFISIFRNRIEFIPKNSYRLFHIYTKSNEYSSAEVHSIITSPIIDKFSEKDFIKNLDGFSEEGISRVSFESSEENIWEIQEIIEKISEFLPSEVEKPLLTEDESFHPFIKLAIYGNRNDDISNVIQEISMIEGIKRISLPQAIEEKEIKIDFEKISLGRLEPGNFLEYLQNNSQKKMTGTILEKGKNISVITSGYRIERDQKNNLPFLLPFQSLLKIRDTPIRNQFQIYNGIYCRVIDIEITSESNPLRMSRLINEKIEKLRNQRDINTSILYNEWDQILEMSIQFLFILLITCIVGSYLPGKKYFFILFISTVLGILTVLLFHFILDRSINIYSLTGISSGSGVIFDIGNVIIHFYGFREKKSHFYNSIFPSSLMAVLTTLIVFIPFFTIQSPIAKMFDQISFSFCATIIISFIISYLIIPLYLKKYKSLINSTPNRFSFIRQSEQDLISYQEKFQNIPFGWNNIKLKRNKIYIISKKKLLIGRGKINLFSIILLLCISIILFSRFEIFPEIEETDYLLKVEDPSINLDEISEILDQKISKSSFVVQRILYRNPSDLQYFLKTIPIKSKVLMNELKKFNICESCKYSLVANKSYLPKIYSNESTIELLLPYLSQKENNDRINSIKSIFPNIYIPGNSEKLSFQSIPHPEKISISAINFNNFLQKKFKDQIILYEEVQNNYTAIKSLRIRNHKIQDTIIDNSTLREYYKTKKKEINYPIYTKNGNKYLLLRINSNIEKIERELKNQLHEKFEILHKKEKKDLIFELIKSYLFSVIFLFIILFFLYDSFIKTIFILCSLFFVGIFSLFILLISNSSFNCISFLGIIVLSGMSVDPILLVMDSIKKNIPNRFIFVRNHKKVESIVRLNLITSIIGVISIILFSGVNQFQSEIALTMIGGILGIFIYYKIIFPVLYLKFILKKYSLR